MTALANITVKKADGSTDIVWTGTQPSSGDTVPAVWRSNTVGTALSHRPTFKLVAKDNSAKTLRRLNGEVIFPESVVGGDSITRVTNTASAKFDIGIPNGMSDTAVGEFVAQATNLIASTLVKAMLNDRAAAT